VRCSRIIGYNVGEPLACGNEVAPGNEFCSSCIDPMVMYIVVRKSIRMSPPKLAGQVGHAVQMIMEARMGLRSPVGDLDDMLTWLGTSYAKVLLGANEKEWAKVKEVPGVQVVVDLGRTELKPNTETVIAFWPMRKSEVGKVLSRLQILKAPTLRESANVIAENLTSAFAEQLIDGVPNANGSSEDIRSYEQLVHDIASAVLEWKERKT